MLKRNHKTSISVWLSTCWAIEVMSLNTLGPPTFKNLISKLSFKSYISDSGKMLFHQHFRVSTPVSSLGFLQNSSGLTHTTITFWWNVISLEVLKFPWRQSRVYSSSKSSEAVFACQEGCYPWHGAPFNVPSDGHFSYMYLSICAKQRYTELSSCFGEISPFLTQKLERTPVILLSMSIFTFF